MKLTKIVCAALIMQLALPVPALRAGGAPLVPLAATKLFKQQIESHVDQYPFQLKGDQAAALQAEIVQSTREILRKLGDDSYQLDGIREQLLRQMFDEEQAELRQLAVAVSTFDRVTVDRIFEQAMSQGTYETSLREDFAATRTLSGRQALLTQLLSSDLSQMKSASAKRIGMLDRQELAAELNRNLAEMNTMISWKTILTISVSLAAAAFISWAIVRHEANVYEKKTRQAIADNQKAEADLQASFAQQNADLQATFARRAQLRDAGYVIAVCDTKSTPQSTTCAYDRNANVYTGNQICVTTCMKGPTGDQQMPVTSCSSAFVPVNCFVQNPWVSGYNSGYDDGYNRGYNEEYTPAYNQAYNKAYNNAYPGGYHDGYRSGYNSGYDDGYSEGYNDGLAAAQSSSSSSTSTTTVTSPTSGNTGTTTANAVAGGKAAAKSSNPYLQGRDAGYRAGYAFAQLQRGN
jgi:hypothetical protein